MAMQIAQRRGIFHSGARNSVVQRQLAPSSSSRSVGSPTRRQAIEEKRDTSGAEASSAPADVLSTEEARRLQELRAQRLSAAPQTSSSNVIQGALDEAQLITWPKPGKALLDTVLVLAIVAGTGAALFGVNVLLTDVFAWWYSR